MDRTNFVLKQHEVAHLLGEHPDDLPFAPPPLRIPGAQVYLPPDIFADDEEKPLPLAGILRGAEARALAMPAEMVDLSSEMNFPLPQDLFGDLDEGNAADLEDALPEDEPSAPMYGEAEVQACIAEAVEHAGTEAKAEGYEQGYVAAEASLQASFNQRKAELAADVARLQDTWKTFMEQCEPLLASLAFEVVEQLLDAPLPQEVKAASSQALAEAINQFGESTPLEISLHPDDFSRLQAYGLVADLEARYSSLKWSPTERLALGDWVVQSPEAAIRRLREEMVNQLKSRLGLLAVMKNRDS